MNIKLSLLVPSTTDARKLNKMNNMEQDLHIGNNILILQISSTK